MCTKIMCAGIQELERGKGERNPFFLYYSQTSSPNRSYAQSILRNNYAYFFKPRLLHVCLPMHDIFFLGGWGGGGTKASPLTVDRRLA